MSLLLLAPLVGLAGCQHEAPISMPMEIACFQAVRVSLKDAILTAEEQVGGRAIDASYRRNAMWGCAQDAPGVYDVTVAAHGQVRTVTVHARSREMGEPEANATTLALLGGHTNSGLHFAQPASDLISLSQAIEIAERHGGKAIAAWIENLPGKTGYRVELVHRGQTNLIWVNSKS